MTAPRVELRGVGHAYGGRVVLAGVDRVLEPGRSLGLLGPNGSGKSTLLRCIAGLLRPRAGSVLVDGQESCELPPAERARVAYAGHRPLLWGGLSARENLVLSAGLYGLGGGGCGGGAGSWPASRRRRSGRPRRSRRASASASRWPARCCPSPQLLVLDEPHSGLDEASSARLDALLADARGRVTIVLATHERVASRAALRRAPAPRGAALSAPVVPVRARREPARAHRRRARAPRAAARARDGAVRRRGAGRAALRRRHRPPAGRAHRRLALGHAAAGDAAGRGARVQRRARRGAARRARARADPAHGDLGGQGDRDRRAARADGGRRRAALVPVPARRRPGAARSARCCSRWSRATSGSRRSARSWRPSPPRCADARSWSRCSSCRRPCRC